MPCELFDVTQASSTRSEGLDQTLVGFKASTTQTAVGHLSMFFFRQGNPVDHIINLKHYESSTLIATYAPVGDVKTSDISTDTSGQEVVWNISPTIALTTNSRLVIDDTSTHSGENRLKGLAIVYDSNLSLWTTYGTPGSWTESTGYTWCGCMSASGVTPPSGTGTRLPPPPITVQI